MVEPNNIKTSDLEIQKKILGTKKIKSPEGIDRTCIFIDNKDLTSSPEITKLIKSISYEISAITQRENTLVPQEPKDIERRNFYEFNYAIIGILDDEGEITPDNLIAYNALDSIGFDRGNKHLYFAMSNAIVDKNFRRNHLALTMKEYILKRGVEIKNEFAHEVTIIGMTVSDYMEKIFEKMLNNDKINPSNSKLIQSISPDQILSTHPIIQNYYRNFMEKVEATKTNPTNLIILEIK